MFWISTFQPLALPMGKDPGVGVGCHAFIAKVIKSNEQELENQKANPALKTKVGNK